MTKNHIKNLGISLLFVAFLLYALILHYTPIGIAIAVVSISAIALIAFVYKKEQYIVEKLDVYLLIVCLCTIALHYQELIECFTTMLFVQNMDNVSATQILSLIGSGVLYLIFSGISKSRKTLIARVINKIIGLFLFSLGLSVFCWGEIYLPNLTSLLILFVFFGILSFCRANHSSDQNPLGRPSIIAALIAVILIVLSVFFPYFRITNYNPSTFLSITVLPWYMAAILTAVLGLTIGLGLYLGNSLIDADTIFLSGLIGLVWVAKASIFYYFQLSWIAVCVYTVLFISFTNRFVRRSMAGEQTFVHFKLTDNEEIWIVLAAIGTIVSVYLIHTGYVYFWLSLLIGIPLMLYLHNISMGWRKDSVFWISILLCVALLAIAISLQNGFSLKKIVFIAAMLVFTSVVMFMLNYRNEVGRNKFRGGKVVMVLFFALLSIIPAYKAGANTAAKVDPASANAGAIILEEANLQITITPDGEGNKIKEVQYIWTDSFLFEKSDAITTKKTSFTIPIENRHLVIWTEDANGVISRADYWFSDAYREDAYNAVAFRFPSN